jgi:uncharacterized protein (TIGR02453 family)
MITKDILNFLKALKENNNREWFEENRAWYEKSKQDFSEFVELLIHEVRNIDPEIGILAPKDCMFRIYRDVRFSKDKSPYKTNFGAYISRGGKKLNFAGYYFHMEPGEYFLSGGVYMPQGPVLKAIRQEIFHRIDEFHAILNAPSFKKHFIGLAEMEKMKTAPKDFPKDFPYLDLLKHKHYTVMMNISEKQLTQSNLLAVASDTYKAILPLNRFLNNVIEDVIN